MSFPEVTAPPVEDREEDLGPEALSEEDIAELAFISGVSASVLRLAADGQVRLDAAHLEALRRARPQMDLSALTSHRPPTPHSTTTRRGTLPPGCELTQVLVAGLRRGDQLMYSPPGSEAGRHWIEMDRDAAPEPGSGALYAVHAGGIRLLLDPEVAMRIARPIVSRAR